MLRYPEDEIRENIAWDGSPFIKMMFCGMEVVKHLSDSASEIKERHVSPRAESDAGSQPSDLSPL